MAGPQPRHFIVSGPFAVPVRGHSRSRSLDRSQYNDFWAADASVARSERGCYVFALRRRGLVPIYIGRTTRQRFDVECFSDRNYRILHEAMDGQMGTLVLFLLSYQVTRGKPNDSIIGDLEKFLIEVALERNPTLKNRAYAGRTPGFIVDGVHRSPRGRPTASARALRVTLGL